MSDSVVPDFAVDQTTIDNQERASNPRASAWVGANAGSGKTYVLAQRVIRLLLDGAEPSKILCLTYTKAAAAEMSNRVIEILAGWTLLNDAELRAALTPYQVNVRDEKTTQRARRLFALALEAPGGLKIQTIHAFCERLLHQFPVEANVAGHFEVLDDAGQERLTQEAQRDVLLEAANNPDGIIAEQLQAIVLASSDGAYEKAVRAFLRQRRSLMNWIERAGGVAPATMELRDQLGLSGNETSEGVNEEILHLENLEDIDLVSLAFEYQEGGARDYAQGEVLKSFLYTTDKGARYQALQAFLFTKSDVNKPKAAGSLGTKRMWSIFPDLQEKLMAEQQRFAELRDKLRAIHSADATTALLSLGHKISENYVLKKGRRGLMDFNDLIDKTVDLLTQPSGAAWVQYKLDKGLDHILVDEAQDTSPQQWRLITALVDEFFSGESARQNEGRTIFAVGDEKQSIYSFQGASPEWFSNSRRHFAGLAKGSGKTLHEVPLYLSFRSTGDVLGAVDEVFKDPSLEAALSSDAYTAHSAARKSALGRVEIWPAFETPEKVYEPEEWWKPVDSSGNDNAQVRMAERIASTISHWIETGERLEGTGAKITAGDILILTRKRGPAVDAINRALKQHGVPVAGADRLSLSGHILVQDLMALTQVMLLSEHDLALACVLKSPLIGLSEDDLFVLAHERKGTLWAALYNRFQNGEAPFVAAYERLSNWRNRADFVPPFDFYNEVLNSFAMREAYVGRVGSEAEDIIEAFLQQVLNYEETEASTLQGFASWFDDRATTIKRDMEAANQQVRVMTVHGSKGLEAPIVFIADTSEPTSAQHSPSLIDIGQETSDGPYLWAQSKGNATAVQTAAKEHEKAAEIAEYYRLLYVAMTRPRERLYVLATTVRNKVSDQRWYSVISKALRPMAQEIEDLNGEITAWRWANSGNKPAPSGPDDDNFAETAMDMPDYFTQPALMSMQVQRIAPSRLGGNDEIHKAVGEQISSVDPRARGIAIHRLLERLPDLPFENREVAAQAYLSDLLPELSQSEQEEIIQQLDVVLNDFDCFGPNSRAEVDVIGKIKLGDHDVEVSGQIDRLVVEDQKVRIIDFKSDRSPPASVHQIPAIYQRQLALYGRLLSEIYPDKEIETALLYTQTGMLLTLDAEMRRVALAQISSKLMAQKDELIPSLD